MTATRLAVPAYFHPALAPADWAALNAAASRLRAVVLNVDSGPGHRPVPAFSDAASRLAGTGVPLLGYVDTDYGGRPARLVRSDIARYRSWYPVSGVFLDRAATTAALLPWYDRLVARVRELTAGQVVLNHGTHPDHRYGELGDALVTFEGPWTAYRELRAPAWVREHRADRFWHLVYATPPRRLRAALRLAAARNVATVYLTDRTGPNPWDALPAYFHQQSAVWTRL